MSKELLRFGVLCSVLGVLLLDPGVVFAEEAPVYAKVYAAKVEPGSVVESSRPGADVGDPDDGRLRIIELYEAVIKDRDAYADEVAVLSTRLEAAYQLLEQSETSGQVVKEQRDALQETIDRLEQENGELTARLTTAQIRRLEAEKMLLEIQIESYRLRQAEEAVGTTKDSAGAESVAMGGKR